MKGPYVEEEPGCDTPPQQPPNLSLFGVGVSSGWTQRGTEILLTMWLNQLNRGSCPSICQVVPLA